MRSSLMVFVLAWLCSSLAFGARAEHKSASHRASLAALGVAPITCSPAPCVIPERLIAPYTNWSNFVVNPANTQQLLSGGASTTCSYTAGYASFSSGDGGETWSQTCLPPLLASNPYVGQPATFAYNLNNVAYAFYASENNVNFNDVVMSTSTDNGQTWNTPVAVVQAIAPNLGVLTGTVDANASSPFANSIYIVESIGDLATGGSEISVLSSHDGGNSFQTANVAAGHDPDRLGMLCGNRNRQRWHGLPDLPSVQCSEWHAVQDHVFPFEQRRDYLVEAQSSCDGGGCPWSDLAEYGRQRPILCGLPAGRDRGRQQQRKVCRQALYGYLQLDRVDRAGRAY